jgi:hypothetical protein
MAVITQLETEEERVKRMLQESFDRADWPDEFALKDPMDMEW